jgi:hypothetical protein
VEALSNDLVKDMIVLFKAQWTAANLTNKFTPEITEEWYLESWTARRVITVKELFANHVVGDLSNAEHRVNRTWQLDCWADNRDDVADMRAEVDRILNANDNSPITGVTFMVQQRWADNSFLERDMFRYTLDLNLISYENV